MTDIRPYFREEALRAYEEGYDSVEIGEYYRPIRIKYVLGFLTISVIVCAMTVAAFLPKKIETTYDCVSGQLAANNGEAKHVRVGVWTSPQNVLYFDLDKLHRKGSLIVIDTLRDRLEGCLSDSNVRTVKVKVIWVTD